MADPRINEFVSNHTGADTDEFIEVLGDPNTDLSGFSILVVEGDTFVEDGETKGAGLIDQVFHLGMTDADGYWTTGFLNN